MMTTAPQSWAYGQSAEVRWLIMAIATAYAKVLAREFVWRCDESLEFEGNRFLRGV